MQATLHVNQFIAIVVGLGALACGCATSDVKHSPQGPATPLAQLVQTEVPGRVRLHPAWTGNAQLTVGTGYYSHADSRQLDRRESELRFDWFTCSNKMANGFGKRTISKDEGGDRQSNIYTYRTSLPTDAELTAATTVSALKGFFGLSQGFTDGWGDQREMHSTAGWTFFTLKDDATIETVSVFCMITHRDGDPEWRVDSMRVTRGSARPGEK